MSGLQYIFRFLYKIRWWLIIFPLIITLIVIPATRSIPRIYNVDMTIYTGVVSGFSAEMGEPVQNSIILNNTIENIINIIKSKETLNDVCLYLYARHMIYGDPNEDNIYISAENYRKLLSITPKDVEALIDKSSEEKTVENLKQYEKQSPSNFVYGLFHWNHPHYCYSSLNEHIKVLRIGNSDMLRVSYSANDPGVAYQTLLMLDKSYVKHYNNLQFGSTSNAIKYFEQELERVGEELKSKEDSLVNYNVQNRIINYEEQTKQVAALDKEFELRNQDILFKFQSAERSIKQLEILLGENAIKMKNNAEFLSQLSEIAKLNSLIAELESFNKDSIAVSANYQKIIHYKELLKKKEEEFTKLSNQISSQKFTKEGYPTSNFVTQWIEELLKKEKAAAEIQIMQRNQDELNQQYSHFSPIGSTIKRQERSIDFIERSYLSILSSLNAARLRLKSLEMNSASLKLINPPTFPLKAEPSKRKIYVLAAFAGSLVFVLGFFLLSALLDFRLRDRIRTERITGGRVLGAFPFIGKGKYDKIRNEKSITYMCNVVAGYFKTHTPTMINVISINQKVGKSYLLLQLADIWEEQGLNVHVSEWDRDFSSFNKEFILARTLFDFIPNTKANIYITEYPALTLNTIPPTLLREASINILVLDANTVWDDSKQVIFSKLQEQAGEAPLYIYLNKAEKEAVESFTGALPPYLRFERLGKHFARRGLIPPAQ